ncbi:MAG TPA: ribokinase [Ktedonobacterales bacterium]|nr:ribokinase [Ktedonobacterales bacterium]
MPDRPGIVVVLASFILDMVVRAPRRPLPGESLLGTDFGMFVGGKGCNQAIAAARSGAQVRAIGRLGDDVFGAPFGEALAREGIDTTWVTRDAEAGTGIAFPVIEPNGQNSIIVLPRANARLTPADIEAAVAAGAFNEGAVLLAQFEVAVETVDATVELAHARGLRVILNPAPAPEPPAPLPSSLMRHVDLLIPNEHEAAALSGIPVASIEDAERAGRALLAQGCRSVVVTLGERGALWLADRDAAAVVCPPLAVMQVDATAAGDAFCGALAAGLAAGSETPTALRRACTAGALATTRLGAEPSLPTAAEIDALLAAQPRQ